jgi:hypothetical protein
MNDETCHLRPNRECTISFFQLLFVMLFVITELLSIRLSLLRLNPPRLMITKSLRYFGMSLAGLTHHFRGRKQASDSGDRLLRH